MIRLYQPSDASSLLEAALESVAEVSPWLPWCHSKLRLKDTTEWIVEQIELRDAEQAYQFAIVGSSGEYLGGCGLNNLNEEHRFANLGYWVRTRAAGKGHATAAVKELASWGFENTGLNRLEIVVAVGNRPSQRVADKAGAVREGVLKDRLCLHEQAHDAIMYSITRA